MTQMTYTQIMDSKTITSGTKGRVNRSVMFPEFSHDRDAAFAQAAREELALGELAKAKRRVYALQTR